MKQRLMQLLSKLKSKLNKRLILYILLGLIAVVIVTVLIAREIGRRQLYRQSYQKALNHSGQNDTDYVWQEGDVSYQDHIYRYNDDILTFLIMGIDKHDKVFKGEVKDYLDGGQADALFLVVVNPRKEQIDLVSVNRNTLTDIDMYTKEGVYDKTLRLQINLAHGFGDGREQSCERQVEAVSKLFDNIPIHGYMAVNFDAIEVINDSVGGVTLEVMPDTAYTSKNLIKNIGKTITLNGKDAFQYVRKRDTKVFDSAGARVKRQKQYLGEFLKQFKKKTKEDITFPIKLYKQIEDYVVTDISVSEMTYMVTDFYPYKIEGSNMYIMKGTTETVDGFEEFTVDEDAHKQMILELFYEEIN